MVHKIVDFGIACMLVYVAGILCVFLGLIFDTAPGASGCPGPGVGRPMQPGDLLEQYQTVFGEVY